MTNIKSQLDIISLVSIIFLLMVFSFLPNISEATQIIFEPKEVGNVEVFIDPEGKNINVVEGEIKFSDGTPDSYLISVENGQSILTLWPTPPIYDAKNKSISFVGGVPNGFKEKGLLFRLKLPELTSSITISLTSGNSYLNDGKGTEAGLQANSIVVTNTELNSTVTPKSSTTSGFISLKNVTILLVILIILFIVRRYIKRKNENI